MFPMLLQIIFFVLPYSNAIFFLIQNKNYLLHKQFYFFIF